MQDSKVLLSEEILNPNPRKKKMSIQGTPLFQLQGADVKKNQQAAGALPLGTGPKASKKTSMNGVSQSFQQTERSTSDSLPDSATSGNEYRALRRKYLLLEEESFVLGKELKEVEDEVEVLENQKFALLDQLVVLEGLIDPLEAQSQGPRLL